MLIMNVYVTVKPDQLDAFKAAILTNAAASRTEPGCIRFDVIQKKDDPYTFVLVEIYQNEAALDAHRQTPHFQQWRASSGDLFTTKENILYHPLDVAPFA